MSMHPEHLAKSRRRRGLQRALDVRADSTPQSERKVHQNDWSVVATGCSRPVPANIAATNSIKQLLTAVVTVRQEIGRSIIND